MWSVTKVAITIDSKIFEEIDRLVAEQVFANRSKAIQEALSDKLAHMRRQRLAEECAKLDPVAEKTLAEEGMQEELTMWPEY